MRIIQINGTDAGGGAEIVVTQLHRELRRQGHVVQCIVGRKLTDDPSIDAIPFRSGPKGMLRTARWVQRKTGLQNLYSPSFRNIEACFRFQPDVIHVHSLHGVDSFAELSVLRRLSRRYPCVITLHDLWLMTGHCAYPLGCPRWKNGCGSCPDLTLYPAVNRDATRWNHLRKRRVFRSCRPQLAVPSAWLAEQVAMSPILGHLPLTVIPNPVDLSVFSPGDASGLRDKLQIDRDASCVLMVAQHLDNPFKGIDQGIDVLNRMGPSNLRVLLVGHQSDAVARRLNVPVTCLPFTTDSQEMADYYRIADAVLMPSRCETFGLVAAEAMACGTPVIAFRAGGLADVIGDQGAGILCDAGDLAGMANGLTNLLSDAELRSRVAAAAAARSHETFAVAEHARSTLALYHTAMASHDSAPRSASQLAVS